MTVIMCRWLYSSKPVARVAGDFYLLLDCRGLYDSHIYRLNVTGPTEALALKVPKAKEVESI